MADSNATPEGFSLKRWSRRKLDAARAEATEAVPTTPSLATAAVLPAATVATAPVEPTTPSAVEDAPSLPPIESLTTESDYSAFMQPKVDEALKRAALKKLFTDPHFNVMDGLDIYIGDYTQSDPMPEGMLEKLGKVYAAAEEAASDDATTPGASSVVSVDAGAATDAPTSVTTDDGHAVAPVESAEARTPAALPPPVAQATLPLTGPDAPEMHRLPPAAPGTSR